MLDKTVMLFGTALFLSAGASRYWLVGKATRAATLVGLGGLAALLVVSFLDARSTLLGVIPTADGSLVWRYLTTTGHGMALQARTAFGLAMAALLLVPGRRGREVGGGSDAGAGVAFVAGAVGLLGSFSVLSHGAAMGGWWPMVSDLVHFLAAGVWAGGVAAVVSAPLWESPSRDDLVKAVTRLSTMGLLAVLVLAATGVLNALIQVGDPGSFLASGYFAALVVKVALVVVTLGSAALNRFRLLPRLLAGGSARSLRTALRVEAVLLALVIVATGVLTTTAVPHSMTGPVMGRVNVIENAERLIDHLWR